MIDIARKQPGLGNTEFHIMDAADMSAFADQSKDIVVIFDILHHIPDWRKVVRECHRVLKVGGKLFLEEPSATAIRLWDAMSSAGTTRRTHCSAGGNWKITSARSGFTIRRRLPILPFRMYCVEKR